MTDLDALVTAAYLPLEKTAHSVVADAFALNLPDDDRYIVSEFVLEALDVAAFASSGLAAAAGDPAVGQVRTGSRVILPLSDSAGTPGQAEATITLYGPGDVVGLAPGSIIRRYPAPGTQTAEVEDLAHIEFDRPELPWAFSATAAVAADTGEPKKQMRPWLALIVVKRSAVRWDSVPGLPLRMLVPPGELPDLTHADRWGHAQAARSGASLTARLSPEFAPVNLSRLVSSRVLEADTDYVAAVVPITDVGRRRGLGADGGTLDHAWSPGVADTVVLPVYDKWEFRTGADGDFAALALRLKGVAAPWEVGRRKIDASRPGDPMTRTLSPDVTGAKQILRCALFSPSKAPTPADKAREAAAWPDDWSAELAGKLNAPTELGGGEISAAELPDLPIVGPRLYACAQRGDSTVATTPGSDWFAQVNLSPCNRIVAGLGTRVVQRDQEQLMASAWAQIGEATKANRAIALAELAEQIGQRLHRRISDFHQGHLLQVVAPLATRISVTDGKTLAADIAASATPTAAVSGAFRRTLRPGGPIIGHATDAVQLVGTLVGTDAAMRNFTRTYSNPDGVTALSSAAINLLDQSRVATALNIPQASVATTLNAASTDMRGGVLTHLMDATTWSAAPADFNVAAAVADVWREAIVTESPIPVVERIRKQRVGPLAAEMAVSDNPALVAVRPDIESAAIKFNNSVITAVTATPVTTPALIHRVPLPASGTVGRSAVANPITTTGVGRVGTGIVGVSRIDTSALNRVTSRTAAPTAREALTSFAELAPIRIGQVLEKAGATSAAALRAAIPKLIDPGGVLKIPPVTSRAPVAVPNLLALLDPRITVRDALRGRLSAAIDNGWVGEALNPIMWAPTFHRPMYEALRDYDAQWLVPGMEFLTERDCVTVLAMNREFIESFLVGLSDEFSRELLWRGFPTDKRATCFRRFWSERADELASPIHRFAGTALGTHMRFTGGAGAERAVIVVKGDLVKRYPDALIQAAKKSGSGPSTTFAPATGLFAVPLAEDTIAVGVDLSITEMATGGWWVVISEHPTATRFDSKGARGPFLGTAGKADSAAWALHHVHQPIQVAFPATDVIKLED